MKDEKIYNLKLIDFGFSIFAEEVTKETLKAGTLNYMAPEILEGKKYDFQSDVFSLGVIVYFILSGELPFYSEEDEITAGKIMEGDYDLESYSL